MQNLVVILIVVLSLVLAGAIVLIFLKGRSSTSTGGTARTATPVTPTPAPATPAAEPLLTPAPQEDTTGGGSTSTSSSLGMNSSFSKAELVSDFEFDETIVVDSSEDETIISRPAPLPSWNLLMTDQAGTTTTLTVTESVIILGRQPALDPAHDGPPAQLIAVDDTSKTMSKTHAKVERYEGRWWLTDLNSTNGSAMRDANGVDQDVNAGSTVPLEGEFMLGDITFTLVEQVTP